MSEMQLNHPATFPTIDTHTTPDDQNGKKNGAGPTTPISPVAFATHGATHLHPKPNNHAAAANLSPPLIHPKTAFIDFQPLHIVLEFPTPTSATSFHTACHGSIAKSMHPTWVYLPMPHGLKRAKRTDRGEIAFLFDKRELAEGWANSLLGVGRLGAVEDREGNGESREGMGLRARTLSLGQKARDTSKTVFLGEVIKTG